MQYNPPRPERIISEAEKFYCSARTIFASYFGYEKFRTSEITIEIRRRAIKDTLVQFVEAAKLDSEYDVKGIPSLEEVATLSPDRIHQVYGLFLDMFAFGLWKVKNYD